MELTVELEDRVHSLSLELGLWEDLEYLVNMLNGAWETCEYRLEKVPKKRGKFFFIEDRADEDEATYGLVIKKGEKAYAHSPIVHALVMDAYQSYVEHFGDPLEEG